MKGSTRRTDLIDRCRSERNAFIATTARQLAGLPRPREVARLLRILRRMARVAIHVAR